jgi:hypothetical protein
LRDAALLEGVLQGGHHRVLTDQVIEGLRPVFARENDVAAVGLRLRPQIKSRFSAVVAHATQPHRARHKPRNPDVLTSRR